MTNMSGGHYDYKQFGIHDVALQIESEIAKQETYVIINKLPSQADARMQMALQLKRVGDALHALDLYDSGDTSDWDEVVKQFALIGNVTDSGPSVPTE